MKKLFGILVSIYFFYFLTEFLFSVLNSGEIITYDVVNKEGTFSIKEQYVSNRKYNDDFYTLEVNDSFYFRIYQNARGKSKIIKDVQYFKDDQYECIYPTFKVSNIETDILCKENNRFIHYHSIIGKDSALDEFASSLENYSKNNYVDKKNNSQTIELATIYPDNFNSNLSVALTSYRGIYNIRKNKATSLNLYSNDVYDGTIHTTVGKYYVVANYNLQHQFSSFLMVDLTNDSESELNYNGEFSFSSYIQGVVENSFYLFDPDRKVQYKITPRTKKVEIISDGEKIQYFNGKEFIQKNMEEAIATKLYFKYEGQTDQVLISKGDRSGYRYFLTNVGGKVEVSRASIDQDKDLTYLFTVDEVRNVSFYQDVIFFIDRENIKMYSDSTGVKTLVSMGELTFNKNLNYNTYVK